MKGLSILSTGSYVPPNVVTNEMFAQIVDTSDEWISTRTGIKERRMVSGDTAATMAVKAALEAVKGFDREKISVIITATLSGTTLIPGVSCVVQKELGLRENILAFDINAACSGFVYGLHTARGLLSEGEYALIIGSETLSNIVDYKDRNTCVLFGDGAGAVLAGLSSGDYGFVCGTVGSETVITCPGIDNGKNPFFPVERKKEKPYMYMEGREVFKFAVEKIVKSIETLLRENNLAREEIDYYVCHQANSRIIGTAAKKIGVDAERFFMNIDKYGNTSAASIPVALDEMAREGLLRGGKRIICTGFGGGLTYGAVYLNIEGQ